MIRKKIFNILLFLTIGLFSFDTFCEKGPYEPNQEDLEQLLGGGRAEKMETMMQQMQSFYENLPEEQKKQFEAELSAEVQKEQEKLAAMSPDEQRNYMESAFSQFDNLEMEDLFGDADDYIDEPMLPLEEIPEKKVNDKKTKEEEKENKKKIIKERLSKIDAIIKLISRIEETLSGITKGAQTLVDSWKQKRYIQTTWDKFSTSLGELKSKLEKIKATDPKTEKYYYLDNTKKANKLFVNLDSLLNVLEKYEPNIETVEVSELKEIKLKNEVAKSALRGFINFLSETSQTTLSLLDELIKAFEPEAKKLAAEEERLRKMGERPVRKRPGRTVVTGRPDRPRYSYDRGYEYGDDYGWPGDSGYYTPSPAYSDYTPSYESPTADTSSGDTSGDSSKPSTSKGKKAPSKAPSKEKAGDPSTKTPSFAAPIEDKYKEARKKQHPELCKNIKEFKEAIVDDINKLIEGDFSKSFVTLINKTDIEKELAKRKETPEEESSEAKKPAEGEDEPTQAKKPEQMSLDELKDKNKEIEFDLKHIKKAIKKFTVALTKRTNELSEINKGIKKVSEEHLKKDFKDKFASWQKEKQSRLERVSVIDALKYIGAFVSDAYKHKDKISPERQKEFLEEPKDGYNLFNLRSELKKLNKAFAETAEI